MEAVINGQSRKRTTLLTTTFAKPRLNSHKKSVFTYSPKADIPVSGCGHLIEGLTISSFLCFYELALYARFRTSCFLWKILRFNVEESENNSMEPLGKASDVIFFLSTESPKVSLEGDLSMMCNGKI